MKCNILHPVTKSYVWKTKLLCQEHLFYVTKKSHEVTHFVRANPEPFGLSLDLTLDDDPELSLHSSFNDIMYSQESTARKSLDFNARERCGGQNALNVLPEIDGNVVQKTLQDVENEYENFSETLPLQIDEIVDDMDAVDEACTRSQPILEQPVTRTSLTPANPKKFKSRGKVITPDQVKALVEKNKEKEAVESLTGVVGSLKLGVDTLTNTVREFKSCVTSLANRNAHEVQHFNTCMKNLVSVCRFSKKYLVFGLLHFLEFFMLVFKK